MKRLFTFMFVLLFITLATLTTYAHSGGTDYKGGHYDHSTGEYHYHHGHPAHDLINGECPYVVKAKEKQKKQDEMRKSTFAKIIGGLFIGGMAGWLSASLLYFILALIFKKYEDLFIGKILAVLTLVLGSVFFIIVFNNI